MNSAAFTEDILYREIMKIILPFIWDIGIFIISWIITSISLFIVLRLPFIGVEIDKFITALRSAIVFGVLNATLGAILNFIFFQFIWKFFPFAFMFSFFRLFSLIIKTIINTAIFVLAAAFVDGFTLRNGFWSALFGSIALSIVNWFLAWFCFGLLSQLGIF